MSSPVNAGTAVGAELELLDAAIANDDIAPTDLAVADAPRWLLPAGELYATAQAAPNTERTYRSTLRSFALFVQAQLGLAPTIDALLVSTVLDYKRYLQADDPATGHPRAQRATVAKQLSALSAMPLANGNYLYVIHRLGLRRPERYLTTLEYGYWYQAQSPEDSWIFRYEYQREPEPPYRYPRCHLHVRAEPMAYVGAKPFADLHLPTGDRVTIESVLRHLIEEHDVPPISPNWQEILDGTEAAFRDIQQRRARYPAPDSN